MPTATTTGIVSAVAAHMRLSGWKDVEGLLQCGMDKKNAGIVQSTRNEFIGRVVAFAFEMAQVAYISYTVGAWLESEVRVGNERARTALIIWHAVLFGTFLFAGERGSTGSHRMFVLLVDWLIRLVSPRQANAAREQEEALLKVDGNEQTQGD